MKTINIYNLRTDKPINLYDIRVDRGSPLGNPFYMSNESKRDEVCDKYDLWIKDKIEKKDKTVTDELNRLYRIFKKYGKLNLYCWCAPKRCHSESIRGILLEALNR